MTGTRFPCALIAVCLIAAATAKPSDHSAQTDTSELKGLLSAMKRYLQKDVSGRTNAHDDVRTVYDPCKLSPRYYGRPM